MSGLLEGRIASVTGGGSGIGRAIALGYAKEGARVVVLDANAETAGQTEKSIQEAGAKAWSFKLDVTERDTCRQVAAQIAEKIGQVSILVNNVRIPAKATSRSDAWRPPIPIDDDQGGAGA